MSKKILCIVFGMLSNIGTMYALEAELTTLHDTLNVLAKALSMQVPPQPQPTPKKEPGSSTSGKLTNEELWDKLDKSHVWGTPLKEEAEFPKGNLQYEIKQLEYSKIKNRAQARAEIEQHLLYTMAQSRELDGIKFIIPQSFLDAVEAYLENLEKQSAQVTPQPQPKPQVTPQPKLKTQSGVSTSGKLTNEELWTTLGWPLSELGEYGKSKQCMRDCLAHIWSKIAKVKTRDEIKKVIIRFMTDTQYESGHGKYIFDDRFFDDIETYLRTGKVPDRM